MGWPESFSPKIAQNIISDIGRLKSNPEGTAMFYFCLYVRDNKMTEDILNMFKGDRTVFL